MSVTRAPIVRSRATQRLTSQEVASRSFSAVGNALVVNTHRACPQYGANSIAFTDVPVTADALLELHNAVSFYVVPDAGAEPNSSTVTIEAKTQLGHWIVVFQDTIPNLTEVTAQTAYRVLRVTVVSDQGGKSGALHLGGE